MYVCERRGIKAGFSYKRGKRGGEDILVRPSSYPFRNPFRPLSTRRSSPVVPIVKKKARDKTTQPKPNFSKSRPTAKPNVPRPCITPSHRLVMEALNEVVEMENRKRKETQQTGSEKPNRTRSAKSRTLKQKQHLVMFMVLKSKNTQNLKSKGVK